MPEPVHSVPGYLTPDRNTQASVDDGQLPPDPLLESGTFIDVDNHSFHTSGVEFTPLPLQAVWSASKSEIGERKARRLTEDAAERPSWLPEGWKVELRMRSSGASAGSIDRYYVAPNNWGTFRSRKEVLRFLETGMKKRRKVEADGRPSESAEKQKAKTPKRRIGDFSGVNFDFRNPPQNVSWVLTSSAQDKWMPTGGEGIIPESVKQTWDKAFTCITELGGHSSTAD